MYRGFELSLNETDFLLNNGEYSQLLSETKGAIVKKLDEIMLSDGKIDADKIIEEWFPKGEYHVFISHSHKDAKLAENLANWLYKKFKITSFLDSHIWGYANNLLKDLNEKYARKDEESYIYEPAISNAAHVYLMLSTALTEVIDKSECLFFINTKNTLEDIEIKESQIESRTASPWIMHELKTSSMIRRRLSSERKVLVSEDYSSELLGKSVSFYFSVPTEHLTKIDESTLINWLNHNFSDIAHSCYRIKKEYKEYKALDGLYHLCEIKETNYNDA